MLTVRQNALVCIGVRSPRSTRVASWLMVNVYALAITTHLKMPLRREKMRSDSYIRIAQSLRELQRKQITVRK